MSEWYLACMFIISGMILSAGLKKLTPAGALSGGLVALLVYLGGGMAGLASLAAFFALAIWATSFGRKKKYGPTKISQQRNAAQVWANGGVAAVTGALSLIFERPDLLFDLLIASAFSSAAADTISSELGQVLGKKFYNILSWKKDRKGENGVISLEGSLCGLTASAVVALVFVVFHGWSFFFLIIIVAGTMGNLVDSVLGASLERKMLLGNNQVNFLNTFAAAITAACLYQLT